MMKMKKVKTKKNSLPNKIAGLLTVILIVCGVVLYASANWCYGRYGNIGFDAILFTLFSDLHGVESGLVTNYIWDTLLPALLTALPILLVLLYRPSNSVYLDYKNKKRIRLYPLSRGTAVIISLIMCGALLWQASGLVGMKQYVKDSLTDNHFFEQEYVYPDKTELVFPDEKRNLIYIYLESMENTFFSAEENGALEYDAMPELYALADENTNFSESGIVGGCRPSSGASWTTGALVAQSAGIPLKLPNSVNGNDYGKYSDFLPGVITINDILRENGYYQAFMLGSDKTFGGKSSFYYQHGVDDIFDYYSALEDGAIEEGYFVWWGMEDQKLYEYAKEKLTEISNRGGEPFALTLLTVDTHFEDGYLCSQCPEGYADQYETVYACASRQLNDFVNWLKEQSFYDNTVVVVSGDHCSMDTEYMIKKVGDYYERHIYNCFINSAVEPINEKHRCFTQYDMFPTTLAAMGVEIKGDRLGLGTNLFSEQMTLAEKYGFDEFNSLIQMKSKMYEYEFLYDRIE